MLTATAQPAIAQLAFPARVASISTPLVVASPVLLFLTAIFAKFPPPACSALLAFT